MELPSKPERLLTIYRVTAEEGNGGAIIFQDIPRPVCIAVPASKINEVIEEAAGAIPGLSANESLIALDPVAIVRIVPTVKLVHGLKDD